MFRIYFANFVVAAAAVGVLGACGDGGSGAGDADEADASDVGADGGADAVGDVPADAAADSDGSGDVDGDGGDVADVDVGPECPVWWEEIAASDDGPGAGTDGPDPDTVRPDGEARAGRIRDGHGGFEGTYAACRTGDWVVENEVIRVCIADERSMTPMLFGGGNIVDIERVDDPGHDELYYLIPATGLLNQGADSVELVADGSDGGDAVVRVTGPDVLTMFGAATVGTLFFAPANLDFVTEYRLGPDDTALEVVTWFSRGDGTRAATPVGDLVGGGDTTHGWFGARGFSAPALTEALELFVSVGSEHSVGVWSPSLSAKNLVLPEVKVPFGNLYHGGGALCPGDIASYRRYVTVGDGDTWSIREAFGDIMPERDTEPVTFVSDEDAPRHFELLDAGGESVDVVRVDGEAVGGLPAGDYTAVPLEWPTDEPPTTAFTIPSDEPIALPAPELGRVDVIARVILRGGGAPRTWSMQVDFTGPVTVRATAVAGSGRIALPPGDYDVVASAGPEFSAYTGNVHVDAGAITNLVVGLTQQMDTTGWMAGDMHQHATPSPDSQVPLADRVLANVGAGVDFIAPSDHDAVGDFGGAIEALDVSGQLHLLSGEELSPGQGHINLFPRTYDRQAPYAGAIPLGTRDAGTRDTTIPATPEYIAAARAAGVTLVQINHPRGPLSHFDTVEYDPVGGPDANAHENWFDDFDAIEVYNLPGRFCTGLQDWFSLLDHGLIVTGVGNSDTHNLHDLPGWPRNYVRVEAETRAELTDEALIGAIKAGRVTVSGGIFVELTGGLLPGDTIDIESGADTVVGLHLQAPAWVEVDELVVFENGRETQRVQVERSPPTGPLDVNMAVGVSFAEDAYVVFVAHSSTPLTVVYPGFRPFGLTNPIFFDVGGDGWTAPGVSGAMEVPVPENLPNCR